MLLHTQLLALQHAVRQAGACVHQLGNAHSKRAQHTRASRSHGASAYGAVRHVGMVPEGRSPSYGPHQPLDYTILDTVYDAVHVERPAVLPRLLHHSAGAHSKHLLLDVELAQPVGRRGGGRDCSGLATWCGAEGRGAAWGLAMQQARVCARALAMACSRHADVCASRQAAEAAQPAGPPGPSIKLRKQQHQHPAMQQPPVCAPTWPRALKAGSR